MLRIVAALIAVLLAVLLAAPLAATAARAQEPQPWADRGAWKIYVDPGLGNGCYASRLYGDGTYLRIGFDIGKEIGYMLITNRGWSSVRPGDRLALEVVFTSRDRWDASAYVERFGTDLALVMEFDEVDVIVDFMKKHNVEFRHAGERLARLSLKGSYNAFAEVVRCQEHYGGF